jgi:hypothetical protein
MRKGRYEYPSRAADQGKLFAVTEWGCENGPGLIKNLN